MKKVLLCMPCFNCFSITRLALTTLLESDRDLFDVVVVENGTDRDLHNYLKELSRTHPHVEHYKAPTNLGVSASLNEGIDRCMSGDYRYMGILNNDLVFRDNFVEKMLAEFVTYPEEPAIGSIFSGNYDDCGFSDKYYKKTIEALSHKTVAGMDMTELVACLQSIYGPDFHRVVGTLETPGLIAEGNFACVFLERGVLEQVGYLDEWYYPGMLGDSDYYRRMAQFSIAVKRSKNVYVHHWESVTMHKCQLVEGRECHDRYALGKQVRPQIDCVLDSCIHNDNGKCLRGLTGKSWPPRCTEYRFDSEYSTKDGRDSLWRNE